MENRKIVDFATPVDVEIIRHRLRAFKPGRLCRKCGKYLTPTEHKTLFEATVEDVRVYFQRNDNVDKLIKRLIDNNVDLICK